MKKWILIVLTPLAIGIVISSCLKNNNTTPTCSPLTTAAPANEVASLKAYIDTNHIAATQDSRGFFYSIDSSASTGTTYPNACSAISVTYVGTYLNGTGFDSSGSNTPVSLYLSNTIAGWQEAVPLMKINANMTLYLPPSLAYGASDYSGIPGNSYLIFRIKLLSFN